MIKVNSPWQTCFMAPHLPHVLPGSRSPVLSSLSRSKTCLPQLAMHTSLRRQPRRPEQSLRAQSFKKQLRQGLTSIHGWFLFFLGGGDSYENVTYLLNGCMDSACFQKGSTKLKKTYSKDFGPCPFPFLF